MHIDCYSVSRFLEFLFRQRIIPVTGSGGTYGCEALRLPNFLDSRLRDGGEVVSLKRRLGPLYSEKDP
jgi:hypothetical protein